MALTQKQKALGEKAIKLKFNTLINHLESTKSKEELPEYAEVPCIPSTYHYDQVLRNWANTDERRGNTEDWPDGMVAAFQPVHDAKQAIIAAEKAYEEAKSTFKGAWREAIHPIVVQNDQIKQAAHQATLRRKQAITQLEVERDEAILTLAFDGEDETKAFLTGMPTAESLTEILATAGLTLTRALPASTGIGAGPIPHSLRDSTTSVKVKVIASNDDDDSDD